ncbi:probable cytochrome P450 6a13 isoform X1 [Schistocerca piceifrons]|uniref:probable cytochrome P450 6a13 isoform X1 n=1 Tax=Schistocerca piceifrons TaxID=274613 RepID=UPI001F5EA934|nr:probable cytochrome P450 6a13 isoform X1 [Schistocerca piceifrons]XP_047110212.1 probable cytochrome P450 6a13 isoform X1 [Schistocerca piceifrons]XP_047110213.1 probable cytochrome P450 6a13 isoform X1 [Schistocerca piceifrons]XP_047110214.1 probable cytochrome P450 6a13 isoform X1 [Schistocerca piceifrons]
MSLTGSCLGDVVAAAALVVTLVVLACRWFYGYWERRGVPSLETQSIFGNCKDILLNRKHFGEGLLELYRRLDPHPYGGIFISLRPMLVVRDPELIKSCLLKDFGHFQHRGLKVDEEHDPLSAHLFNLGGPRWRALRTKLTPTFTSGKMKLMFPLMEACAREMVAALQPLADRGEVVEMKEWNARFTTDVIGTCAFGIQCNSLRDPDSEFRRMGRGLFTSPIRNLFNLVLVRIGYLLRIKFLSPEHERFFMGAVRETVDYRKKNGVVRNDFVNLLLQLQQKGQVDPDHDSPDKGKEVSHSPDTDFTLTDELLAAQCLVFFVAGFETSSTTMSFCIHELAVNPHIQDRLRDEVDSVLSKHGGQVTYEAVHEMSYLDMVVAETLRKYPPLTELDRICTVAYTIPGSNVKIEEGTKLIIPVYAIHHDPKYYPDPEKFDPERFTEEQKASRHHFVYLPFGEGPRICIGMRFGLIQTKLGIASLVSKFIFSATSKTPAKLQMDPKATVASAVGGINVRITART